jgi:hypothetical protein
VKQTNFHAWRVELDSDATRSAYTHLPASDPQCCSACTTFLTAIQRDRLPPSVTAFLAQAGADPTKPQEVWGAPEDGFLSGSWIVVGRLLSGEWDGTSENAYAELGKGFRCWLTGQPSMRPPAVFDAQPVVQLEFEWHDPEVAELSAPTTNVSPDGAT